MAAISCELYNEPGTNVYKDRRKWAELGVAEVGTLTLKKSSFLNFDFPDDGPDGNEWSVKDARRLKIMNVIGQGHIYPSQSTGTTIQRRTFSFQAVERGTEDVIFVSAIPDKEEETKTYTVKFIIN